MLASPIATLACVESFAETDFRADMAAVTVPTFIIHGGADATVPPAASADRMAAMLPNAVYRVYEDAPHGLFFTDKASLNRDLLAFLSDGLDAVRREPSGKVLI